MRTHPPSSGQELVVRLIEETAWHAGHADVLPGAIDGSVGG